jgi:GNAT superfamily N-acetyltransferase
VDKETTGVAHLYSMYVDPPLRRGGLGRQLVARICDWAREGGMRRVILNVTETNAAAIRMYESCGFVPTGRRQPLSHTPALLELEMGREL